MASKKKPQEKSDSAGKSTPSGGYRVYISGVPYRIRRMKPKEMKPEKTPHGSANILGFVNIEKKEIAIRPNLSENTIQRVLIHEFFHALCAESSQFPAFGSQVDNEVFISHLTDNLLSFARQVELVNSTQ